MEYGLLVALIAVIIAVAVASLGGVLRDSVDDACKAVTATDSECQTR